jgi:SAM-dependent methyltransferase
VLGAASESNEQDRIACWYDALASEYGHDPATGQQRDRSSQDARLRVLLGNHVDEHSSVLDFGCGTARLLSLLKEEYDYRGEYTGVDISGGVLELARAAHPGTAFLQLDVRQEPLQSVHDVVIVNGVFNNYRSDNWVFMTETLELLFRSTRHVLAFNNLSTYVDFVEEGLYYVDPGDVFAFCKTHLSPNVTLRHDYSARPGAMPYEFSTFVYRHGHEPRPQLRDATKVVPSRAETIFKESSGEARRTPSTNA